MASRKLSKAEQEYILKNYENMSAEEMCSDMHGIGTKTVQDFIDENVLPEVNPSDTAEERHEKIRNAKKITAGKLMGRDPERGIAVMTSAASEVSDSRRRRTHDEVVRDNQNRVFIMDKNKKAR